MEIILNGKNGGISLVSNKDFKELSKYKWHKNPDGYVVGYVNGKTVRMHRLITMAKKGQIIDHIHGDR